MKQIRRLCRRDRKRADKTQKSQSDFCVLSALKTFFAAKGGGCEGKCFT
jgi:hypothetical protein